MRHLWKIASATLISAVLLGGALLLAQQGIPGTLTQGSPTRLDAVTNFATVVASATTLTISPPGGQFVYITQVEITDCAGTTVTAAAPTLVTTTGLGGGTTPVWTIGSTGTASAINLYVSGVQ